jgi:hypothetical protein
MQLNAENTCNPNKYMGCACFCFSYNADVFLRIWAFFVFMQHEMQHEFIFLYFSKIKTALGAMPRAVFMITMVLFTYLMLFQSTHSEERDTSNVLLLILIYHSYRFLPLYKFYKILVNSLCNFVNISCIILQTCNILLTSVQFA